MLSVWTSYSARQAALLLGISESTIRTCIRSGLVGTAQEVPAKLSFRDLSTLRLIKDLSVSLPPAVVRRELVRLKQLLAPGAELSEIAIEVRGDGLAFRGSAEAPRGQLSLFGLSADSTPIAAERAQGELFVLRQSPSLPTLTPVSLATAEEWFSQALALEDINSEQAIAAYRKGLALRPDATDAWVNLGRVYADKTDFESAMRCFRTALELDPCDATCHYNMGVVAQDQGREADAIRLYRRALELDGGLAEAHYNLATLYDQTGDAHAAIRHINEYRKLTKGKSL